MERTEVLSKIHEILVKVLKHNRFELRDELTAKDVDGWDSLSLQIITEIEATFNVKFKLKELNKLKNMGTLIELIESKL
ncbi:MAG: hypothetical protein U0T72_09055 [Chitinophagales bacterium]